MAAAYGLSPNATAIAATIAAVSSNQAVNSRTEPIMMVGSAIFQAAIFSFISDWSIASLVLTKSFVSSFNSEMTPARVRPFILTLLVAMVPPKTQRNTQSETDTNCSGNEMHRLFVRQAFSAVTSVHNRPLCLLLHVVGQFAGPAG